MNSPYFACKRKERIVCTLFYKCLDPKSRLPDLAQPTRVKKVIGIVIRVIFPMVTLLLCFNPSAFSTPPASGAC